MRRIDRAVSFLFSLLFFVTPLILFPHTSEIFEFNKMVFVYMTTILISSLWIGKMILSRKIIFRRTIIDIPLLLFLLAQIITTITSIDLYTSIFGYFGRFNGGLLSTISYSLLYWAFVSNIRKKETKKAIYSLLLSGLIVSIWGILEHFGLSPSCVLIRGEFNADCWVQDVQNRVFATLGQPNWMAAFLVALIPLAWSKLSSKKYHLLSLLLLSALLYTKSRSGLLGFTAAYIIFWGFVLFKNHKKNFKPLILTTSYTLLAITVIGTPWTPNAYQIITKKSVVQNEVVDPELNITESEDIRKIVWSGALDIFKNNPIVGTGVETFAYSYYKYRPIEHNATSEWDYIYNKAHNEYLNHAANSGILGLCGYALLIFFSIYQISKAKKHKNALLAGYTSLLVTNFFGFSVVTTNLLFFLFPAIAFSLHKKAVPSNIESKSILIFPLLLATSYLLLTTSSYWYSDILFVKAKNAQYSQDYSESLDHMNSAIALQPHNPTYYSQMAKIFTDLSVDSNINFASEAEKNILLARSISPGNINLLRTEANIYMDLTKIDEIYLGKAIKSLEELSLLAPTDPKVFYLLGLSNIKAGKTGLATENFKKALELKNNYEKPMSALKLLDSGKIGND